MVIKKIVFICVLLICKVVFSQVYVNHKNKIRLDSSGINFNLYINYPVKIKCQECNGFRVKRLVLRGEELADLLAYENGIYFIKTFNYRFNRSINLKVKSKRGIDFINSLNINSKNKSSKSLVRKYVTSVFLKNELSSQESGRDIIFHHPIIEKEEIAYFLTLNLTRLNVKYGIQKGGVKERCMHPFKKEKCDNYKLLQGVSRRSEGKGYYYNKSFVVHMDNFKTSFRGIPDNYFLFPYGIFAKKHPWVEDLRVKVVQSKFVGYKW